MGSLFSKLTRRAIFFSLPMAVDKFHADFILQLCTHVLLLLYRIIPLFRMSFCSYGASLAQLRMISSVKLRMTLSKVI